MNKRTIQLTAGLVVAGLMVAPSALAWFGDDENSAGNLLGASNLDLLLLDLSNTVISGLVFDEDDFEPGDMETESLKVKNDGALDFTYKGLFAQTSGDTALCDALDVEAQLDGGAVYTGPLSGFIANPAGTIVPGASHTWDFEVSLDDGDSALEGKTCEFDWVFMGWQTTSDGTWGFTDTEEASNQISTGSWTLAQGAVVINELMWMGSDVNSSDEWIELRNTTNADIDVAEWTIDNAKSGGNSLQIIPSSQIVPANGFLLIANSQETSVNSALNVPVDVVNGALSLANSGNGNLVLRDSFGNVIDEAKGDDWPAGENGSPAKRSMERNSTPGDGTSAGSWHTCINAGCNDDTFWDVDDGDNYGTPGATNLSENDPTSEDYTGPPVAEADEEEEIDALDGKEEEGEATEDADEPEDDNTGDEETGDEGNEEDGDTTDENDAGDEGKEEDEEDTGEDDESEEPSADEEPDDEEGNSEEEPSEEDNDESTEV